MKGMFLSATVLDARGLDKIAGGRVGRLLLVDSSRRWNTEPHAKVRIIGTNAFPGMLNFYVLTFA
jgi:hypothetical protein